jgi:tetratricopeptide (TPR) repeat protein
MAINHNITIGCLLIGLLFFSRLALAIDPSWHWYSQVDEKYEMQNPKLYRKYQQAVILLDRYYGDTSLLKQAHDLLIDVLSEDSNHAPAYQQFGRLLMKAGYINYDNFQDGSLKNAEQFVRHALKIEPYYDTAMIHLSRIKINNQQYQAALNTVDSLRKINPASPYASINRADILVKADKDYMSALTMYKKVALGAYGEKPTADALSGMASTYKRLRKWESAQEAYQKAFNLTPDSPWAAISLANFLLFYRNDPDGAVEYSEKALSIMDFGMGRFVLACAFHTQWARALVANDKNAEKFYEKAISLYPDTDEIIEKTAKYKFTKMTSEALKWRLDQG